MRNYSPVVARRVLWTLLFTVSLFIGFATWLATRTIGQVESIQQASDELEIQNFRVGARLRSQIYRLSSVMLRFEVTGVATFREQFVNYRSELQKYLEELSPVLVADDEVVLIAQIYSELDLYYREVENLFAADEADRKSLERVERMKAQLDSVVEFTYRLADSRRGEFRQLLANYREASRSLERYIFLAVGALLAAAASIVWLAYQAYMNPVRRELSEAKSIAHQKEELATIGALAGGIAHEIRNPITGIRARSFALAEMLDANSPAARQASIIDDEVTRMERILNDFLDFARPQEPNVERCDLRELLTELHSFHRSEIESQGHEFKLDLPPDDTNIVVEIDPGQIRQVVTNLVRNAGESFPKGESGTVTLGLFKRGGRAVITVVDDGAGMPAVVAKRVFDPFFSKKRGGTGLGLAISKNITEKHGGTIRATSAENEGTVFELEIPLPVVG